jgi:hypothetical protein
MNPTRIAVCTLTATLLLASVAGAVPTPEEKCTAAKLDAQRKKRFCVAGAQRAAILGKTADVAKCTTKFDKQIAAADKAAAAKGTSCRWLDNADGTATDLSTGLQWELKTDDGTVHDKDNTYTWNAVLHGLTPNGTAFTDFLGELNGSVAPDGTATPCFAGKCDWRLPQLGELRGLISTPFPDCTLVPCTTIIGPTAPSFYWTRTHLSTAYTYTVSFGNGIYGNANNGLALAVRAVRTAD